MELEYLIKHQSKVNAMSKKEKESYISDRIGYCGKVMIEFLNNNFKEITAPSLCRNNKLKSTYGQYDTINKTIEIATYLLLSGNDYQMIQTLLHELIHHICKEKGLRYHDGDLDFENMLKVYNVQSTETDYGEDVLNYYNVYSCKCKKSFYPSKRNNYRCSICKEDLIYNGVEYTCESISSQLGKVYFG